MNEVRDYNQSLYSSQDSIWSKELCSDSIDDN